MAEGDYVPVEGGAVEGTFGGLLRTRRTWLSHRTPVARQEFVGAVWQIIGGRTWSLCLVTKIKTADQGDQRE